MSPRDTVSRIEADAVDAAALVGADPSAAEDASRAAVLDTLRTLTERAERGEILAIAVAAVQSDGVVATAYEVGALDYGWIALVGASSLLHDQLIRDGVAP